MRHYLTFDGEDSRDFGVYISGSGTFSAPARAYNMLQIPGRNGDIVGLERRFENTTVTYPAFIYSITKDNLKAFRNMLLSKFGYCRLQDSYHPEEFRMALYRGPFEPEMIANLKAGSFDLTFEAKPQRYLIEGEREIPITDGMNLSNPTRFEAKPVILASAASGTVRIQMGGVTIAFRGDGYTRRIDCETGNCYRISSGEIYPANGDVTLTGGYDFPGLQPGDNTIRISGGSGTIIPRWFEL